MQDNRIREIITCSWRSLNAVASHHFQVKRAHPNPETGQNSWVNTLTEETTHYSHHTKRSDIQGSIGPSPVRRPQVQTANVGMTSSQRNRDPQQEKGWQIRTHTHWSSPPSRLTISPETQEPNVNWPASENWQTERLSLWFRSDIQGSIGAFSGPKTSGANCECRNDIITAKKPVVEEVVRRTATRRKTLI